MKNKKCVGLLWLLLAWAPFARTANMPADPQLRIEAGMHTASVNAIDIDETGRWAVTVSNDKTARVWEVATGKLLQVLRPPIEPGAEGMLNAVGISPDGRGVAVGGWTKFGGDSGFAIYLFEVTNGRLLARFAGLPNRPMHIAISHDARWLAATLGGTAGVRVWDLQRGKARAASGSYGDSSLSASWSHDGRLVTSSLDGKLRLYRPRSNDAGDSELVMLAEQEVGPRPSGVAFHPDGTRIAVGYEFLSRVHVVDGNTLALLHTPAVSQRETGARSNVAWSGDGLTLAAGGSLDVGDRYPIRLWGKQGRDRPRDVPTFASTVMALRSTAAGGWLATAGFPAWGHVDTNGIWTLKGVAPIADFRGQSALLDADGNGIQFGYAMHGMEAATFSIVQRQLSAGALPGAHGPDTVDAEVEHYLSTPFPSWRGNSLELIPGDRSESMATMPGSSGVVLGSQFGLQRFGTDGRLIWRRAMSSVAWGVNIPRQGRQAGKLVVAAYGDGTIRWHRLSDGQELLAFFPHADRKRWVLWTPSGYYDASPGAEDLIGWHVNRGQDAAADFFPASRFRSRFFRPDVIDRVLDTLDEGQALAQADAARGQRQQAPVSVAQVLPPVVELLSGAELRTSAPQVTLRLRARSASDAPVTSWRVRVDGQAVADMRGLQRSDANMSERELSVPVPAQDSEIQVFAENRHGTSTPAVVRVAWAGAAPAKPAGFQIQPKLYVLAVGVGAYQHAGVNRLSFPAKDARDFTQALQRQKGRLYRDVEVKLLTDTDATADAVVDGLDWLKRQVTQHDLGMVFVAGHGTNDADLGYTFLPVNADPERLRRTGVPMAEFKLTLSRLAGKALFFFDTCHSGNVLGGAPGLQSRAGPSDLNGVINDFASAENGVVVFSSSTGRQLSYEHTAWGNGAFTKALVEGLDGRADFQKNGRITHKMLDLYVSERVKALTEGRQSPVTQAPGGVPDFPVAIAKP